MNPLCPEELGTTGTLTPAQIPATTTVGDVHLTVSEILAEND